MKRGSGILIIKPAQLLRMLDINIVQILALFVRGLLIFNLPCRPNKVWIKNFDPHTLKYYELSNQTKNYYILN